MNAEPPRSDCVIILLRGGQATCASYRPPASGRGTSIKNHTSKTQRQRKGKIHFPPEIGGK